MANGNFLDFIEKASEDQGLREDLLNELHKEGVTPESLLEFFVGKGYDGVSRADCVKLLGIAEKGNLKEAFDAGVKY
ncbi:MAG: hypothetical protein V1792_21135 [Pseudomonadota bacterium]